MSAINLSLDQIIDRQKQSGRGGAKLFNSRPRGSFKRNLEAEYQSMDRAFTRSKDVPMGRWDHGGFEQMYGFTAKPIRRTVPIRGSGGSISRMQVTDKVRLHISNLAKAVVSADLIELFRNYNIESANVHYDEFGHSIGTADVVTDRATANEIIKNFDLAVFDGRDLKFHLIDQEPFAPTYDSVSIRNRLSFRSDKRPRGGGIFKKPRSIYKKVNVKPGTSPADSVMSVKKHMTQEELDRELDEYMSKRSMDT